MQPKTMSSSAPVLPRPPLMIFLAIIRRAGCLLPAKAELKTTRTAESSSQQPAHLNGNNGPRESQETKVTKCAPAGQGPA